MITLGKRSALALFLIAGLFGCEKNSPTAENKYASAVKLAEMAQEPAAPKDKAERQKARAERQNANANRVRKRKPVPREDADQLAAMGYVQASEVEASGAQRGVVVNDKSYTAAGLNLFTSAHAPIAYLMDNDGKVLHSWTYSMKQAWPDYVIPDSLRDDSGSHWRRVYLYPNGDLLAVFENIGLLKLDKNSKLLWAYQGNCHHAADVAPDGHVFALANNVTTQTIGGKSVWTRNPVICELDADGKELQRIDVLECFRKSLYRPLLDTMRATGDIFHANTIHVLDGTLADRSAAFQKGNILICSRQLSCIAIVDPKQKIVVWGLAGMWQGPHEPTLLPNGHMIIFDNRRFEGASQVLEFDPFTQEVFWRYAGTKDNPLWSEACSLAQRLPNGNTLVTETQGAHVIEVTPDQQVVWEFYNPNSVSADKGEKLANIHMMIRLPADFDTSWLKT